MVGGETLCSGFLNSKNGDLLARKVVLKTLEWFRCLPNIIKQMNLHFVGWLASFPKSS